MHNKMISPYRSRHTSDSLFCYQFSDTEGRVILKLRVVIQLNSSLHILYRASFNDTEGVTLAVLYNTKSVLLVCMYHSMKGIILGGGGGGGGGGFWCHSRRAGKLMLSHAPRKPCIPYHIELG